MSNILALAQAAAATATDMTQASTGGGDFEYVPPAEGPAFARFVAYIETGVHERSAGAGKPTKRVPEAVLIFELVGPRHEPTVRQDGTKVPHTFVEKVAAGANYGALNEKATLYKLFTRMNYAGKAKHISELVGAGYLVTVRHEPGRTDPTKKFASIRDADGGYTIQAPRQVDVLSNTVTELPVPPAISPLRLFMWNQPDALLKPMWESIFIDGAYEERKDDKGVVTKAARSKNVWQERIQASDKFPGSPIQQFLQTNGVTLTLGAEVQPAAPAAAPATVAADPLAGLV